MQPDTQTAPVSKTALWTGYVISALPVLLLLVSAGMKLAKPEWCEQQFKELGYNINLALFLGCIELACTIVYLIPRTAVLGAILLTGYLGGATATHVRIGDPFLLPVLVGALVWLGLFLRDPRLRDLIPLRRNPSDYRVATGGIGHVLKVIGMTLVVVVVILVGIAAVQPTDFRITRSATIAAPPSAVFAQINDFHRWDAWSPWAKLDPAAKNTFEGPSSGTGAVFKWSGNDKVGEGSMKLLESRPNDLIKIKLEFVRPFPDIADTDFTFKPQANETLVTWTMSGERGFMAKGICLFMNMDKLVGGDFEKGLANLKSVVEGNKAK